MYIGGKPMSLKLAAYVNIFTQAVYVTELLILTIFQRQVSNINCQYNFFLKNSNAPRLITIHYYKKKTFTRRFKNGLRGGWAGCPPRLIVAGQPAQQPPRLMLNRGGQRYRTTSVNAY